MATSPSPVASTVTGAVNVTVQKAPAVVTLVLTASGPTHFGQPATFTATLCGAIAPTGTVRFLQHSTLLGSVALTGGVATFTTASLPAGTTPVSAAYDGDGNNAGAVSNTVSQAVDPSPALAFPTPPAASLTVAAGASASTTLTVASLGTLAVPVTLTASGLPQGATCTCSSQSVDVSGGPATITLTFSTTGPFRIIGRNRGFDARDGIGSGALLACGLLALGGRKRRKRFGIFLSALALILAGGMTACSSHGSGGATSSPDATPRGTYAVTLTARAPGATQASTTIQMIVH